MKYDNNSIITDVQVECLDCGLCSENCELLYMLGESPQKIAERFELSKFEDVDVKIAFSCNLCGLCEEICPQGLNIGDMFLEIRRMLTVEGLAPLPEHKELIEQQSWVSSKSFRLVLPEQTERLFFPGCSLCGYSPELITNVYFYLKENLTSIGVMLACCGAPMHSIGYNEGFREHIHEIKVDLQKAGSSELIVACPECFKTLKYEKLDVKLRFLSQVLLEIGLPDIKNHDEHSFYIFDACTARHEKDIRESVRTCIKELGYGIVEANSPKMTGCCGFGGMCPYVDPKMSSRIQKKVIKDIKLDILTYCASCREAFAMRKPSLHYLDLIFNPNWKKDRLKFPRNMQTVRKNQKKTKELLRKGL